MSSARLPQRRTRTFALVLLALALGLSLAACGGSKKPAQSRPESQPIQGGSTLAAVWPLTGLPAGNKTPKHRVLAVKIPNTAESYPQTGMSAADMVSEELVEGGITRLAVFYYSRVPSLVGPVRSMRASDMGIVKPLHAVLVSSGAAPPTLRRLSHAHIPFYTGGPGYFRDSSAAPYNLMVHLRQLVASMKKKTVVPANYLPWGAEKDFAGTKRAGNIAVKFSAGHTTQWKYAGGKYHNTNSYAPANDRFNPDSVLVLRVREGNAGYLDPAGNPVPETIFQGKGALLLFHKGKVERGTWSKKKLGSQLVLRTKKGALKVPAGHVWLELTPVDHAGGHVSWTK
ncbi:DUF3048 domain-containing protein [Nocardioides terrisoli]|uniref:DUF3048 domain-containing protein n=1 Tax=Nocardioides terrisoli TaxID=3388267 RepID=UPI00287BB50A|nr:DUF3048 domain-containing protein [Nocardioides marmorisolisilvae]